MRKLTRNLVLAGVASVAAACLSAAYAEEKKMPEKPAVPTLGQVMEATGVSITGYIDASYTHLSGTGTFTGSGTTYCTNPGIGAPTPTSTCNRVFDTERRSFNLNAVDLTISALPPDGWGGMVNLTGGSDAKVITSAGTTNDEFDVTQAYVHYAKGGLMAIAGKYVTASGAEVIKSPSNTNFSRSILFGYAIPFTHTGVRAYFTPNGSAAAPDGKWTFIAGVNNGWDIVKESSAANTATDGKIASGKTIEIGANGNITKDLILAAVYYTGDENSGPTVDKRNLLDLVLTFNATDKLSFVLNYDQAEQKKALSGNRTAKWDGIAAYVNYKINDLWRLSFRAESFNDKDGYRTGVNNDAGGQKWKENTLTLAYLPTKNVELRGEVRADSSNVSSFNYPDGTTKKSQNSFGLEAIYKF
jgi:hypothetical protein